MDTIPRLLCSRSSSAWRTVERVTFSPRTSSSPGKRVPRSQEPPHGHIPLLGCWRTWFHSLPPSPIPVPAPNSPCWNPKAPECWWLPSPNSRWTTLGELSYGNCSLEYQMITQHSWCATYPCTPCTHATYHHTKSTSVDHVLLIHSSCSHTTHTHTHTHKCTHPPFSTRTHTKNDHKLTGSQRVMYYSCQSVQA